jgi:hypothetical protein
MKTLAIALAAATVLTAGAAAAQPYGWTHTPDAARTYDNGRGYGHQWMSISDRQARLDARIERGIRSGDLTRREAWRLRREFNNLASLEARYRSGGLNGWERADLDRRFDALSAQIRFERSDGDRYGYNAYPRY